MLNKKLMNEILDHAKETYPNECCGLLIKEGKSKKYIRCTNVADATASTDEFIISAEEYSSAEDRGEILAVVHSHPDASTLPSIRDRAVCSEMGIPWVIVSWPEGDVRTILPENFPLEGRPFCHGTDLDCYGLIRDHYKQKLGIELSRYDHDSFWWESGGNMYMDNFEKEGFVRVRDGSLKEHDLIIMQIRAKVPNHGGVYLGNGQMLHHMFGKLSGRVVYGGYWAENTVAVLRHKSLIDKEAK